MNTAQILDEVNARFYARFAQHLHQTRNHGWSGWSKIPCILPQRPLRVFDVGCGNGRLAQFLEDAWITGEGGFVTDYLGVDQCAGLLEHAAKKTYSFPQHGDHGLGLTSSTQVSLIFKTKRTDMTGLRSSALCTIFMVTHDAYGSSNGLANSSNLEASSA